MMDRRSFFGVTVAGLLGARAVSAATHYGPVDVDRWMEHKRRGEFLHVYLNGEDVTLQNCFYADDVAGEVRFFKRNTVGKLYFDPSTGETAKEIRHGHVVIKPGPATDAD